MNLKQLSLFLTNANHINFRCQLINIVHVIGILIGLTSAIVNIIAEVGIEVQISNLLVVFVFGISYYFARFKNKYKQSAIAIVLFSLFIINVLWFQSGGSQSSMIFYIFLATSCFIIFLEGKYLKIFIPFILINVTALLLLEKYTSWVVPYSSQLSRFLDVSLGAVIVLFLFIILICWFINQYKIERKKSKEKTERIEFLLKELNHRVKNNLQLISSLLGLQASRLTDLAAINALNISKDRIVAMGKVHTLLYQNNTNEATINFQKYLEDFVSGLIFKYTNEAEIDYELIVLQKELRSNEALYLGLIINEAIINSIKYAFVGVNEPKILIKFSQNSSKINTLVISDNGIGICSASEVYKGFGSKIIALLAEQINAILTVEMKNGVTYTLTYACQD